MTELDKALTNLRQDVNDQTKQSEFYGLVLNGSFFIPILEGEALKETGVQEGEVLPLIMESEGNDFLMLFDSKERLNAWSETEVGCVEVPGHVLATTTMPPLHWALNVGTDYSKVFPPDEIAWLRESVERCDAIKAAEDKAE